MVLGLLAAVSLPAGAVSFVPLRIETENREQGNTYITAAAIPGTYNRVLVGGVPQWKMTDINGDHYLPHNTGAQMWDNQEDGWGVLFLNNLRFDTDNNGSYETLAYERPGAAGGTAIIGIFWGGRDDAVTVNANKSYSTSVSGVQFELWQVNLTTSINQFYIDNVDLTSDNRSAQKKLDTWPTGAPGTLLLSGKTDVFEFTSSSFAQNGGGYGVSDVFASVTGGAWSDWDTNTQLYGSDLYLNWTFANVYEKNSLVSSDYGYGAGIPEPLTMLGLFLGVGSLGGYLRRRSRLG
jgi:hypothetical protein